MLLCLDTVTSYSKNPHIISFYDVEKGRTLKQRPHNPPSPPPPPTLVYAITHQKLIKPVDIRVALICVWAYWYLNAQSAIILV